MSVKGGYRILSLRDLDFTPGTAKTVPGLHQAIEGSHRKPYLLSGIVVGGVEYGALWVNLQEVAGTYTATVTLGASVYTLTVTAEDAVTFTAQS